MEKLDILQEQNVVEKIIKGDGEEKNNWKIVIGKYNVESMIIPWCAKNFNQSEETEVT